MSSRPTTTTTRSDLADALAQVGLVSIAANLEDFLARMTKARLSPRQMLEEIARIEVHIARIERAMDPPLV